VEAGVIRPCGHPLYKVSKPREKKWRITIDFRNLNSAIQIKGSWPLPNIEQLLQSFGFRGILDILQSLI
jgi:hypothetical protein